MAANRLNELGMWQGNMNDVIGGLVAEAHRELDGGSLVRVECDFEPFQIYLGTRENEGEFTVVGMTTILPPELGGVVPDRDAVDERLHSRSLGLANAQAPIVEGNINAWLPFPVEVL
jgi:hypothetical protein